MSRMLHGNEKEVTVMDLISEEAGDTVPFYGETAVHLYIEHSHGHSPPA